MSTIGNTKDKFQIVTEADVKNFLNGEIDNAVGEVLLDIIKTLPGKLKDEIEGKKIGLELVIELKSQKAFKFTMRGASKELSDAFRRFYIVQY